MKKKTFSRRSKFFLYSVGNFLTIFGSIIIALTFTQQRKDIFDVLLGIFSTGIGIIMQ